MCRVVPCKLVSPCMRVCTYSIEIGSTLDGEKKTMINDASNVALPEHVRAGRTCSGKATLRTGRLAGWDTQHTSMSPPLLWRLGSCSASHTAVMVQAPARGLSTGLLLTHDAWHPHWTTLGPTPVKKDQEFARHGSAMVRLARGNAIDPSAERKPRIFHTVETTSRTTCSSYNRPNTPPQFWYSK